MLKEITKRRSLMGLIYGLVMLIPFCSVLVRCVYVQFNKNAYQSYSQNLTQNYSLTATDEVRENEQYQFTTTIDLLQGVTTSPIYIKSIVPIYGSINIPENPTQFRFYYNPNNQSYSLQITGDEIYYSQISSNGTTLSASKTFSFIASASVDATQYEDGLYHFTYENDNTLDNVFDYSLNKVINDNNFGKLNLINWFTGVFLDANNSTNMLYLHFINWYLNYALLVSCAYLLFLVLMWFVNLAQRLLTRFEVDRR